MPNLPYLLVYFRIAYLSPYIRKIRLGVDLGGWGCPPTFGQQHFLGGGSHTTDIRSGVNGFFYVSHNMVMSDKTAIFQLESQ